jgi:hypothetical protein
MSDELPESGEELVDESGRNPTQRRIDENDEAGEIDAPWDHVPGSDESEPSGREPED